MKMKMITWEEAIKRQYVDVLEKRRKFQGQYRTVYFLKEKKNNRKSGAGIA
jgi:hypothetical protein